MVSKRPPKRSSSALLHLDTRFATPDDISSSDSVSETFWGLFAEINGILHVVLRVDVSALQILPDFTQ